MNRNSITYGFSLCMFFSSLTISTTQAGLAPNPLFGDNAVLQRERPVAIWGEAKPDSKVKVSFGNQTFEVLAGTDGRWMGWLPELRGGEQGDLIFESDGERVASRNVVAGDVWLCTGQSNIEWTIQKSENAQAEIAAAQEPMIRQYKVPTGTSTEPSRVAKAVWEVCSPSTAGGFTAIGYYMARDLLRANQLPQGLINCSWGGTSIETWLSAEAVASDPELAVLQDRWNQTVAEYPTAKKRFDEALTKWEARKKEAERSGVEFTEPQPNEPNGGPKSRGLSRAYNAMMHPLAPYTIRGDIWYQGEANSKRPMQYESLLRARIRDVRSKWVDETLPVIIMQLPSYGGNGNSSWPYIREAQASVAASLPNTGLVVTVDLGDPKNVHPVNKQSFGERTAQVVRRVALGEEGTDCGPEWVSAVNEGNGMRLQLKRMDNLLLKDGGTNLGAFELAGADRIFHPARAAMDSAGIFVSSESVPNPIAVRYAWRESPYPTLFSKSGIPAAPFRSDDWPPLKP